MTLVLKWGSIEPTVALKWGVIGDSIERAVSLLQTGQIAAIVGPVGAAGSANVSEIFTPVNGQTAFVLIRTPADFTKVRMIINGQSFKPSSFTIIANTLTWGSEFTISENDEIEIIYT